MKFIVTIDLEEDNWKNFPAEHYTISNINEIPELQQLFDQFGIRPTYLITYQVAANPTAVHVLKPILESGRAEIGAHCHPWNTPPFEEQVTRESTMLCNLPAELQFRKIRSLTELVENNFGIRPVSFRAGRWGYSETVGKNLRELGYRVDTSITPYTDWSSLSGPDFSSVPLRSYWSVGDLLQVPATVGFLQSNFAVANRILRAIRNSPFDAMRISGALGTIKLLNRVNLSPELDNDREMAKLTKLLMKKGFHCVNLFFHSPSLVAGLTPFVNDEWERRKFIERLRRYFSFVTSAGLEPVTLREFADGVEREARATA